MSKRCSLCGKKVSVFGSAKLEDGILCKECARKIKGGVGSIDWKNTSIEDVKKVQKANSQKKRQTFIILACIIALCLGVLCLLPDNENKPTQSSSTVSQEEKVSDDKTAVEESVEAEDNADATTAIAKDYSDLAAGETASFESMDIVIGNPTETFIREGTRDYYIGSVSNAYIVVPVTITAKKPVTVTIEDFPDCVLEDAGDYLPEELSLSEAEVYTGNLLVPWGSGYEGNTSSLAAPVGEGPTGVSYVNGAEEAKWTFTYDTETPVDVDGSSISKVFPNQMIQATGTLEHVDSSGGTVLVRMKVGAKSVEANVDSSEEAAWEAMEGQAVTFTGRVKNLTINVESTFQGEYVVLTEVTLR